MSYRDEVLRIDFHHSEFATVHRIQVAAKIAARADAEIAALRAECDQWREELRIYRETESAECEALRADSARLDWLLAWLADPANCRNIRFDRAMIDAEMEGGGNG